MGVATLSGSQLNWRARSTTPTMTRPRMKLARLAVTMAEVARSKASSAWNCREQAI